MAFDEYTTRWYTYLVRILKTKKFAKLATGEGLTDVALRKAIKEFEDGLTGAALGSNLYKKRVGVGGKGKSGGLRTILVHRAADSMVFCIYVFAKNERGNISAQELELFKETADFLLGLKPAQIKKLVKNEALIEVQ